MKVWGRPNSINVQKVLWCCRELGLSPQRVVVGGEFGGTQEPGYVAMNPNQLVPTLEDDGFVLWESNVIVRYLAQKFRTAGLCPQDIRSRFDCERWMDWQATTLWPALRPVFIGLIRTSKEDFNSETQERDEAKCAGVLTLLDRSLSDRRFVGGDVFSMADIPIGVSVYRWYALDIVHPRLPNLRRWYDALTERPGFRSEVMLPLS